MTELLAGLTGALGRLGQALTDPARLAPLLQALVLVVIGYLLARVARRLVAHVTQAARPQSSLLAQRTAMYVVLGIFLVSALRELGFDFTVILGAAGILTAAAAFASQTSASNIISGLFLGLERSVEIGDVITVNGITGEVLSIDLLSTRLRTFDNLLVRVPNETMVKTEITNLARFPIRRYDLQLGVAYKEDLAKVRRVLEEVADRNPLCLEEPRPLIIAQGYGASSIDLQLSVWSRREAYLDLRNQIHQQVKEAFDREGIEIPYPHVSVYAGQASGPLPLRLERAGGPAAGAGQQDAAAHARQEDGAGPVEDATGNGGARG